MTPNRNSTTMAPTYTSTCTTATNSAASSTYMAAMLESTTTRYSAACTTFFVLTTRTAATRDAAARMPKAMFSGSILPRHLLLLRLGSGLVREVVRHGLEPLAELRLVVQQL